MKYTLAIELNVLRIYSYVFYVYIKCLKKKKPRFLKIKKPSYVLITHYNISLRTSLRRSSTSRILIQIVRVKKTEKMCMGTPTKKAEHTGEN